MAAGNASNNHLYPETTIKHGPGKQVVFFSFWMYFCELQFHEFFSQDQVKLFKAEVRYIL